MIYIVYGHRRKTHIISTIHYFPKKQLCQKNVLWVKFQDYAKVFLPSDIQIRMAFCKIFKRCFLLISVSCQSIESICRCFETICSAKTSAWASQSSGSHIRWDTFHIRWYILHFTSHIAHQVRYILHQVIHFTWKQDQVSSISVWPLKTLNNMEL